MRVFDATLQDGTVVLTNKSNKKVLLRLVTLHYEVTVLTIEDQRSIKTINEDKIIEKEIKSGEKIKVKSELKNLKSISIVYTIDDRTFREDIEF
ncbi:hypothetical protein SJAV_22400 [Sulfurisphaera javensis]|uniref:Uncharacterized protein n=1 Tax=Sulfurisphaera javensis TaxID=2049879 RepID=A0AAT9GUB7_9CREN